MKKLIFLLLISMPFSLMAQRHHPTLYILFQSADFGTGIRGDYYINRLGLYSSVSYGGSGLYGRFDIKNHTKITTGVLLPMPDYDGITFDITAGINYHILRYSMPENLLLDPRVYNPWSFELGTTFKLKRFALGMRTDILRWEPCVDIGIKF